MGESSSKSIVVKVIPQGFSWPYETSVMFVFFATVFNS